MWELASELLASEADEVCTGDHGDVSEREDKDVFLGQGVYDHNVSTSPASR